MANKQTIPIFLLLIAFYPAIFADYLSEVPVKLLDVRSVASRYPAANSEYRTNIENGQDEEVDRTESDTLNDFPSMKMTLLPGGCGFYEIPIKPGQIYAYIQPAKKEGEIYWDYCDKAPATVEVSSINDEAKRTEFDCFYPDDHVDPCSSKACHSDISAVVDANSEIEEKVKVKLCTAADTTYLGSIWEINFSTSNMSNKLEGFFVDEARQRLRQLEAVPDFNTQLSFVSIVGGRGVGKSTVASLLSGNASLFDVGSASIGTTTTGADLSPIIPSQEWANIIQEKLGLHVAEPKENYPMFLVDSEGMGTRGEAFDFITTSPPAVIAKTVIWIGTENVQTVKILNDIESYLNGLDNIVLGQSNETNHRWSDTTNYCSEKVYGQLVVIINKMMGGSTDVELQRELMENEPDYIDGYEERNQIREKMRQCFEGINVHGLPMLSIPEGESVDYPFLNGRFKDGLAAISNSIAQRLDTPRQVTVAGKTMVLNATNAEVIIGTVIAEANNGMIDLNGFTSFWSFIQQEVNATLGAIEAELKPVSPACGGQNKNKNRGLQCSTCVCEYRNNVIESVMVQIEQTLQMAKTEAMNLYETDLSPYITKFMDRIVHVWRDEHSCSSVYSQKHKVKVQEQVCDISALNLETPGQPITMSCNLLFFCEMVVVDTSSLTVVADSVHVGDGATLQNVPPVKGQNGADGVNPGDSGLNGAPGANAFNMVLEANRLLKSSANQLIFISQGGAGGNGGNGKMGGSNLDQIPNSPSNAQEVVGGGTQTRHTHDCSNHCGGHCNACDDYWYYTVNIEVPTAACGGNGGNGGDGGNGGAAGSLTLSGTIGQHLTTNNMQLESSGGAAGAGAAGASGTSVHRSFDGWRRYWEDAGCHGIGGLICGPSYHEQFGGFVPHYADTECPGNSGTLGQPGIPWSAN